MARRLLLVTVALLMWGTMQAHAQETHPAQPNQGSTTHGIIRKAQPKAAQPAKPAAPASPEAVAAAIATAVRSVEEAKKPMPRPRAVRPVTPPAAHRRYTVRWPSQRVEVRWETPEERITLSWSAPDSPTGYARDDRRLEP